MVGLRLSGGTLPGLHPDEPGAGTGQLRSSASHEDTGCGGAGRDDNAYKSQAILRGRLCRRIVAVAPFTETSGTFINTEGRVQSFNGVVAPLAETRPAWKILRVLGNMLELDGFDYDTPEQVRADILLARSDVSARLDNNLRSFSLDDIGPQANRWERNTAHR